MFEEPLPPERVRHQFDNVIKRQADGGSDHDS
jgi:hypothetical protein